MTRSPHIVTVTDASFEAILTAEDTPMLLDFSTTWCPPCRAMDPHVAAMAAAYVGRVRVAACDVDDNPATAIRFSVQAAPTFLMLHRGRVVERVVGAMPRAKLEAMFQRALAT